MKTIEKIDNYLTVCYIGWLVSAFLSIVFLSWKLLLLGIGFSILAQMYNILRIKWSKENGRY